MGRTARGATKSLLGLICTGYLVQFALVEVSQVADWAQRVVFTRHITVNAGPLLSLEMVLDVLEVGLLVFNVLCHTNVAHVFPAKDSKIVQCLRHFHNALANVAQA